MNRILFNNYYNYFYNWMIILSTLYNFIVKIVNFFYRIIINSKLGNQK